MLGKIDRQATFYDLVWEEKIPKNSIFARLRTWASQSLCDEDFAELYSTTGRPSCSPLQMTLALLIELEMGYSDQEMEEESRFDDRVKFALMAGRDFDGIDAVTLCDFRARLLKHDFAMELLWRTLQSAREVGLITEENLHVIDSFIVHGASTRQNTYALIRTAIKRVLQVTHMHNLDQLFLPGLVRSDYVAHGKPKIDWNDSKARQELLESLVHDGRHLLQVGNRLDCLPNDLSLSLELLRKVIEQDIATSDNGTIAIKQGTATDRIISVHDPDMRHGRKTTSSKSDGYKAHIVTTGTEGDLVSDVDVTGANVPDGRVVSNMLATEDARGYRPPTLLGDTAYFNPKVAEKEAAKGTIIIAKAPPVPRHDGLFTKDDFKIDTVAGTATCPAGNIAKFDPERIAEHKGVSIRFSPRICQGCPMQSQCTVSKKSRILRVNPYEPVIQRAREDQQSEPFKQLYRKRSVVERVNAQLTRHGARKTRYIGLAKTKLQQLLIAVTHNIRRITRPISPQKGELCSD